MIFTWRGVKILPFTLPSSDKKGSIHFLAVRSFTRQRTASCLRVIGCRGMSTGLFIFDDFEVVWILDGLLVDVAHGCLGCLVIHDAGLATAHLVGSGKDGKVGRVGEEERGNGGESVANDNQVAVVLTAGQQHGTHSRIGRVGGDIGAAVITDQQAVLEEAAHLAELVQLPHDYPPGTNIRGNPIREARMHEGNILPFILMWSHNQHPAAGAQSFTHQSPDVGRLTRARFPNKHHLKDLTGLSRLFLRCLRRVGCGRGLRLRCLVCHWSMVLDSF